MVEGFEAWLVQVRFGFNCGAQHGAGLTQAFTVVLLGTATQRQQRQAGFVRAHHLALAAQQGLELLAQFSEGGVAQPALAGLDEGGGQHGAVHLAGLGRFTQRRPCAGFHRIVQAQVVGQGGFFGPVVAGRAAGQQLRCEFVDADGAGRVFVGVVRRAAALREVGPQPGQLFGLEPNLLADFVAHAAQKPERNAINGQQPA